MEPFRPEKRFVSDWKQHKHRADENFLERCRMKLKKKKNKFCGLIYRIRRLFDKKYLLMFYNSFPKTVICYGLLIYGTAAKIHLKKIEMAQRRILRPIFFKQKYDSLVNILQQNQFLSVLNSIYS